MLRLTLLDLVDLLCVCITSLQSKDYYTEGIKNKNFPFLNHTLATFFKSNQNTGLLLPICHFVSEWIFPPNMASSALLCFWTVICSCQYLRYTHMRLPFFLLSMFSRSAQCLSLLKISFRSVSRSRSAPMGSLTTLSSMFFSISSR